ncbi:hypothetical protein [Methylocella silvestris]|uniref:Major tropism determinant N-terminal domain-containing protein n=1 Tax=Methylocella silvestris TaxID=199596 RepID=A0A2J7TJU2_METSI|nr:hypothetical protein [Methylocella silvestris]PNG26997.1 hypothetical protein CR492_04655 [Methylocella silvestris]
MSVQVQLRREAASFLSTFVGALGELLFDTTNKRLQVHDGATAGGFPVAKLSEVSPLSALMIAAKGASYGAKVEVGCLEGSIACAGATSVSTVQIPNGALVLGVSTYVATAITGAGSFRVDATTASGGSAGTTAGQFGTGLGAALGSNNKGVIGPTAWYANSTITLTGRNAGDTAAASFTGGVVHFAIHYILISAPTS